MIVYNSHLQLSENFEISKILFQTCHFRRQRFGQEFGINFFGDIRTSMTEQSTDNRHGKALVQCKDRKRMPGCMEQNLQSSRRQTSDDKT